MASLAARPWTLGGRPVQVREGCAHPNPRRRSMANVPPTLSEVVHRSLYISEVRGPYTKPAGPRIWASSRAQEDLNKAVRFRLGEIRQDARATISVAAQLREPSLYIGREPTSPGGHVRCR